jgi:hypothetical protein
MATTPQQVTITGTLVDSSNVVWVNAVITFQLIPGYGTPINKYKWNNASVNERFTITASSTGTFSVAVPSSDTIIPSDSKWELIISGNPYTPAVVIKQAFNYSTAPTVDISAQFTAIATPLTEVGGGGIGFPKTNNLIKGDGLGGGVDSNIPPTNVALLNIANTFTAPITLSGNPTAVLQAASKQYVDAHSAIPAVTNLLKGDGAGNAADSTLVPPSGYAGTVALLNRGAPGIQTWTTANQTTSPWFFKTAGGGLGFTGANYLYDNSTYTGYWALCLTSNSGTSGSGAIIFQVGAKNGWPTNSGDAGHITDTAVVFNVPTTIGSNLAVTGTLSVTGAKNFVIVHPVNPELLLTHSVLEGPECGLYYRGEGVTDSNSMAEVTLPDYFEALVIDGSRTVHLTPKVDWNGGSFGQLAATEVVDGKFRVYSTTRKQAFYWIVKAVRGDIPPLEVETVRPPHVQPVIKPEPPPDTEELLKNIRVPKP